MRQEPPGDGFLRWDTGTKPEPARNWVGRGKKTNASGGLVDREQLGREGAELAWRSGGGGESVGEGGGGVHTRRALPCPGAAPALRGGGGISRPHPRPGRSARLSPATAAAHAPCVAPATGGPAVSAAGMVPSRLSPALVATTVAAPHSRLQLRETPPPREPGSAPPLPPPEEPIRPDTAPHVTAQPGPAPQVWLRPFSRLSASRRTVPAQPRASSGF